MKFPNDNLRLKYSTGSGNNLGRAKSREAKWRSFCELFEQPLVTPESLADYTALSKDEKTKLKASNGWFLRAPVNKGERKKGQTLPGRLITLDADYLTGEAYDQLLSNDLLAGYEHFFHTTRSHTPDDPRVRIGILLNREVSGDEYGTIVRVFCHDIGIEYFDKASARVAQMMFFPTVSKGQEKNYIYRRFPGEVLDVDDLLSTYEILNGDPRDPENKPLFEGESKDSARARASKAEDPLTKDGPVGAWCNSYSVFDLIEGIDGEDPILGEVYEMAGDEHDPNRVNYIPGDGGAGAIIYDEGRFLFSNHDTDPAGNELVNSWDLVRLHLFGDQDELHKKYDKVSDRPSSKAMLAYASENPRYRKALTDIRYGQVDAAFTDDDVEIDDDAPDEDPHSDLKAFEAQVLQEVPLFKRRKWGKPPEGWQSAKCEIDQNGNFRNTPGNVLSILLFDKRFRGRLAYNQFSQKEVVVKDLKFHIPEIVDIIVKDKEAGDTMEEYMRDSIRMTLTLDPSRGGYGIKPSDADLDSAMRTAARQNTFHPLQERLSILHEKHGDDKTDYLSTFLQEYLGCEDNVYYRTIFRRILIASIHRLFIPGCKWDYMPIIEGVQGLGKSSLIQALYSEKFFGELHAKLDNEQKVVEAMQGCWGMEVPELASMKLAEVEDVKKFVSQRSHRVRMAYGHYVQTFLRQTVFWGTTNQDKPLRDPTGNRRFWIIRAKVERLDFDGVELVVPKLWAQAYREYWALRHEHGENLDLSPKGEVKKIADEMAEGARTETVPEQWARTWYEELFHKPAKKIEIVSEYADLDYDPYEGVQSATNWKKEWGRMDDPVYRIRVSEAQLWACVGNRSGVARHSQENMNFDHALAELAKMGVVRGITRTPSKSQAERGTIRSPRLGKKYLGHGRQEPGFYHYARSQDVFSASQGYFDFPTEAGAMTPTHEDDGDIEDLI